MSDSTGNPSTPPGWYADPAGSARLRWWDGIRWTDHLQAPQTQPAPSQATYPAPLPAAPAYVAPHHAAGAQTLPRIPEGAPVYGPLIWVITLLPLLSFLLLPLAFTEFDQVIASSSDPYGTSPLGGYSPAGLLAQGISTLLGWAIIAGQIVLAYFDHRWLRRNGFVQPFHWAWSFFSLAGAPVYAIGRSIIVRRRSGRGIPPMWVSIAIFALSVVIGIAIVIWVFQSVFSSTMLYSSYS